MDARKRRLKINRSCDGSGRGAAEVLDVKDIPFRLEFRDACAQNACGKYRRCWMCPPDVGDIRELIAHAQTFRRALVFQTMTQIEDSYDFEGMQRGADAHNAVAQALARALKPLFKADILALGAGACRVCPRCAREEDRPCRHPDRAMASLEAYGVAVSELASLCNMNYVNGANSVTYFGAFLFDAVEK